MDQILDPNNTSAVVYADSAYRSTQQEEKQAAAGYRSKILHKGKRNKPLSECKKSVNQQRSQVRARVEHIFGNQMRMGGKLLRCVGMIRAKAKIGLRNLFYNMNRLVFLSKQIPQLG